MANKQFKNGDKLLSNQIYDANCNQTIDNILSSSIYYRGMLDATSNNLDLNLIKQSGYYDFPWMGKAINRPITVSDGDWGVLLVLNGGNKYLVQIIYNFNRQVVSWRGNYDLDINWTPWIDLN